MIKYNFSIFILFLAPLLWFPFTKQDWQRHILPKLLIDQFRNPNFSEQVVEEIFNFIPYYGSELDDGAALRRIWEMGRASHRSQIELGLIFSLWFLRCKMSYRSVCLGNIERCHPVIYSHRCISILKNVRKKLRKNWGKMWLFLPVLLFSAKWVIGDAVWKYCLLTEAQTEHTKSQLVFLVKRSYEGRPLAIATTQDIA